MRPFSADLESSNSHNLMSESRRSCWRNDHLRMCWVFVSNLVEEKIIIESLLKFSYKLVTVKFILLLLFTLLHNSLSVVNILHAFISNVDWNEIKGKFWSFNNIYLLTFIHFSPYYLVSFVPMFWQRQVSFPYFKDFLILYSSF